MSRSALALVLWDIDHTLIEVTESTRLAYAAAFRGVTGRDLGAPWQFDGRTELAAVSQVLAEHGLDGDDGELRAAFMICLTGQFRALAGRFAAEGRVLPGAVQALTAISAMPGVSQSVLTGNLREVAAIKLAAFGLDRYLDLRIGAFGEDAVERTDLPAHALARAGELLGRTVTGTETVIVGDTARDVATALAAGARCVAVATGTTSAAELRAAGAQLVLPDLADTDAVLRAITACG